MSNEWIVMGRPATGAARPLDIPRTNEAHAERTWQDYEASPAWRGRVWIETREVGPWSVSTPATGKRGR